MDLLYPIPQSFLSTLPSVVVSQICISICIILHMAYCLQLHRITKVYIKIAGRNISNLRYADDITLMAESEEELKSLLMKVKVESEKVGF